MGWLGHEVNQEHNLASQKLRGPEHLAPSGMLVRSWEPSQQHMSEQHWGDSGTVPSPVEEDDQVGSREREPWANTSIPGTLPHTPCPRLGTGLSSCVSEFRVDERVGKLVWRDYLFFFFFDFSVGWEV